jgi:hypothetical protein
VNKHDTVSFREYIVLSKTCQSQLLVNIPVCLFDPGLIFPHFAIEYTNYCES